MEPVSIRPAGLDDARAIAEIHVRAWQWAYRGQIPDEILDGLSVEHREQGWRRQLSELRTAGFSHRIWVADRDGKVVKIYTGNEWTPAQIVADLQQPLHFFHRIARKLF